jgi:hypothetical protein
MLRCLPSVHVLVLVLAAAVPLASCIAVEDLPDPDEVAIGADSAEVRCSPCVVPPIVDWVPGRVGPRDLFPVGLTHLHTLITQADSARSFYAWGVGAGRVLWIYRVPRGSSGSFAGVLTQGWMEAEAGGGGSHSMIGSISAPPPKGPPLPGQPPFSNAYVSAVLTSAQLHREATDDILIELGGL